MLFLYPAFFSFALSHICLCIQFYFLLFFIFSSYLFLFFTPQYAFQCFFFVYHLKKLLSTCALDSPVLYITYLHPVFFLAICASYIFLHSLFFSFFVFCASFRCLFIIAFSLIYVFSFSNFLCNFKSSFLNSLYIFIVFLWSLYFCTIYLQ